MRARPLSPNAPILAHAMQHALHNRRITPRTTQGSGDLSPAKAHNQLVCAKAQSSRDLHSAARSISRCGVISFAGAGDQYFGTRFLPMTSRNQAGLVFGRPWNRWAVFWRSAPRGRTWSRHSSGWKRWSFVLSLANIAHRHCLQSRAQAFLDSPAFLPKQESQDK